MGKLNFFLGDVQFASVVDDAYEQGRADERKKIMEIIANADDIANAMYLLGQYFISEELKEQK